MPFIGSLLDVARMGVTEHDTQLIKDYGKIVGYFEGTTPVIMCTDTKMLKKVFIKDFNNFRNRRVRKVIVIGFFKNLNVSFL